jgi:hypothetical protein
VRILHFLALFRFIALSSNVSEINNKKGRKLAKDEKEKDRDERRRTRSE